MAHYRLYLFNAGSHFAGVHDLDVETDREAMRAAGDFNHAHGVEVWSGARKIGTLRPASHGPVSTSPAPFASFTPPTA